MTGFYTHRKTAKLRSKVGADANWIVPRLWAYAAESQPDGDLSDYSSEEIAEILGCSKYATSILQALKDCRFVDENGMIHDWAEHNGYHEKYSHRAKIAAAARWSKTPPTPPKDTERGKRKEESGDKHCLEHTASNATSISRFALPTLETVRLQASKIGLSDTEAEKFFNHYSANGWRVGKNPMRSWTHALSNWKLNSQNYGTKINGSNHPKGNLRTTTAGDHAKGW